MLYALQSANAQRQQAKKQLVMCGHIQTFVTVRKRVLKFPEAELQDHLNRYRAAFEQAKKGELTEPNWIKLCTVLNLARAIEKLGVITGFDEHHKEVEAVLQAISDRAENYGTRQWQPPTIDEAESRTLSNMILNYTFQLRQISVGEYKTAFLRATNYVRSNGGTVVPLRAA